MEHVWIVEKNGVQVAMMVATNWYVRFLRALTDGKTDLEFVNAENWFARKFNVALNKTRRRNHVV